MDRISILLLMACAYLAAAPPVFALTFEEVERNIDKRIERQLQFIAGEIPDSDCCMHEETAQDRTKREVAARFINPRPELGCMYYDANNVRHWWPGCREL